MSISKNEISGIILAGGAGQRMGGVDKGWVTLNNTPLISHTLERLVPQVSSVTISANREQSRYRSFGWPVIGDNQNHVELEFLGPVAGILATLKEIKTPYAVIVPVDAPLLSPTLVQTLVTHHQDDNKLVLIDDGERTHPLFGLYHKSLADNLEEYLKSGNRRLMQWCFQQSPQIINAPHLAPTLANINDPESLQALEKPKEHPK